MLMELLVRSTPVLKSPEILLILASWPLLQQESSVQSAVLPLSFVIATLKEKPQEALSEQLYFCNLSSSLFPVSLRVWSHVAGSWWSSLHPSTLMRHIMVFKNALSFMLRSLLLGTHNLQVKDLLEVLKLLFKVYASMLCTIRKNALNICLALEN